MRAVLDVRRPERAIIVVPPGDHDDLRRDGVRVLIGSHPHPSPDAPAHAREVLEVVREAPPSGSLLVLASGGGSSLLELPAEGLAIEDIRRLAAELMLRGADIEELNAVRRALSDVKGGRLAAASRAPILTLVAEDVSGRPELVGSGPTFAPEPDAAAEILARHQVGTTTALWRAMHRPPPAISVQLVAEVVADNESARRAVIARGASLGIDFVDRGELLRGEARLAGVEVARLAQAIRRPFVCGGETTVTVRGRGVGGRSQELVLGAYLDQPCGLICAFGTDGIDGSSPHAGAYLDPPSWARSRAAGLDACAALQSNDSATFFARLGTAVVTGPTGSNVADVCFVIPER